ncbi:carboxypeptidase regulatory-like domain-containing protein [Salininema proteolyticum]|uniref:Carboxypeptidase regulatory-like domain-containing protein n=1 Tax=Salininema proteolyticum TaxID=1607685 RepID=A0ABV8TWU2_9ACTN
MARTTAGKAPAGGVPARPLRRTRLLLTAVLAGLVVGAGLAAPSALAQEPAVRIQSGHDPQLETGEGATPAQIGLIVTGKAGTPTEVRATVGGVDAHVTASFGQGNSCPGSQQSNGSQVTCSFTMPQKQGSRNPEKGEQALAITLTPATQSELTTEDVMQGQLVISATMDGKPAEKSTSLTVRGTEEPQPESIPMVKGTVVDNGEPVDGAEVKLEDSEGNSYTATTDSSGVFEFVGNEEKHIAPGEISLTVSKEGYDTQTVTRNVFEETEEEIRLPKVEEEKPKEEEPKDEEPAAAEEPEEGGMSPTLWAMIIIGALLVIGGIVAIVLLLRGGKGDDDDNEDDRPLPDLPPDHQGQAAQTGRPGVYQASGPGQQQGEAPTMIHNGPLVNDDDFAGYGSQQESSFGPGYDNSATQVMPQYGSEQPPPPPPPGGLPPQAPKDETTILPTVDKDKGPQAPGYGPGPQPRRDEGGWQRPDDRRQSGW